MSSKDKRGRRNFLKNTALTAVGVGIVPVFSKRLLAKGVDSEACDPTTLDYYGEGPFYTQNPPLLNNNVLAKNSEAGTRIVISGRVTNLGCTEVIPNTIIDVWHADDSGAYDNSGYNLRGYTKTNAQGYYVFETIKPGKYLNGAQYRPSHIHFKVTAPNKQVLTTQLYFQGDSSIPSDAAASITSGNYNASNRIIPLVSNSNGILEGTWDIVLDGNGVGVNTPEFIPAYIDKGMIYNAFPNPFNDLLVIKYGVFKDSNIDISVFNIQGKVVATIANSEHAKGKYELTWSPDSGIPKGHYFVALKVNDMQVHYIKVQKI
ncbi:MAG: T9SS type A sorting domain-containing protein [Salibacteraceae bacterium]